MSRGGREGGTLPRLAPYKNIMLKSCSYCGRIHKVGEICPKKPKYRKVNYSKADKFRHTYAWQCKQMSILDRDYHICRICNEGSYGTYAGAAYYSKGLSVHHIEPLDERFDMRLEDENLITCCPWHHKMAEDGDIPRDYLHELAQTSPRWDRSQNL